MREIKFRALVEKSGKSHPAVGGFEQYNQIIKVESITFNDDGVDLVVDENGDEYSYHDETLLVVIQYTGLKDSNGVEIYEGDIVQASHRSQRDDEITLLQEQVRFLNGCFMLGNWNAHEYFSSHRYIEVIGNVYEHPHLMEVE